MIHSPNSRFFNPSKFAASRVSLLVANSPKRPIMCRGLQAINSRERLVLSFIREGFVSYSRDTSGASVAGAVERLSAMRAVKAVAPAVTPAKVPDFTLAQLSNMTVKVLRAMCKAAGHTGYSKLRKDSLVFAMTAD